MRCAVTGVAGFIGSTLAQRLLSDGHDVLGIDVFTDAYPIPLKRSNVGPLLEYSSFRLIEEDLASAPLVPLLDGCTVIFHLAAQAGVRTSWGVDFELYVRRGILATQRLLEACRITRPVRIVHASSSSVYGNAESLPVSEDARLRPVSPYGVAKLAAEHICDVYRVNFGLSVVQLRYFTVYGPRQRPDMAIQRFITWGLRGDPIRVHGDGSQSRDFTYVVDAVEATLAAVDLGVDGATYNIGGGDRRTVRDVLFVLEHLVGKPLSLRFGETELGDVKDTAANTSRARKDLGFVPRTSIEEGLQHQVEWATRPANARMLTEAIPRPQP
jgi:nucleoside-diphosphate-sugar epimerase